MIEFNMLVYGLIAYGFVIAVYALCLIAFSPLVPSQAAIHSAEPAKHVLNINRSINSTKIRQAVPTRTRVA